MSAPVKDARFPQTRWTLIQRVRDGSPEERELALNDLCRSYWFPLYAFARRSELSQHEAEDAVQSFIVDLLARGFFAKADHNEGSLRALLVTAFRRYLSKRRSFDAGKARGGGCRHVPLEVSGEGIFHLPANAEARYLMEIASADAPPDVLFHRKWAENLVARSIERLEAQFNGPGKSERFNVMRAYLPWDGCDDDTAAGAAAAGMSPGAFRTALTRLRGQYRNLLFDEVRQTIGSDDPGVIEDEIRELFQTLAQ